MEPLPPSPSLATHHKETRHDRKRPCAAPTAPPSSTTNNNSLTAGPRGPVLMQDIWLMEKTPPTSTASAFPSGWCTPKASGAYGTFTVTHDISAFSKADLFNAVGKQTLVFLRFSTVAGEKGPPTPSATRGFALKFYTEQATGIWWATTPRCSSFAILKSPDFIHTRKRDPRTNLRSATAAWDFWSLPSRNPCRSPSSSAIAASPGACGR